MIVPLIIAKHASVLTTCGSDKEKITVRISSLAGPGVFLRYYKLKQIYFKRLKWARRSLYVPHGNNRTAKTETRVNAGKIQSLIAS
jgi:hypothetical protein